MSAKKATLTNQGHVGSAETSMLIGVEEVDGAYTASRSKLCLWGALVCFACVTSYAVASITISKPIPQF